MPQVGNLIGPAAGTAQSVVPAGPTAAGKAAGAAELLGLKLGEIVQASVVEELGKGDGIVDVGGRLFRALYPDGLAAGARVALRVVGTGPPLLLKVSAPGEEGLVKLLSPPAAGLPQVVRALLAAADSPEGTEVRDLLDGLQVLRLPTAPAELAPALARLLQKSGLFHEAVLARGEDPADLKSLALRLLSRPVEPALGRLAEALLGHVEAAQARTQLEGTVVVPFVLPWGEDPVHGEWIIEERAGEGTSGEALSGVLRLRLAMPRLGPVEVALRWSPLGSAVELRLVPAGMDAVASRLPELREALSGEAAVRLLELKAEPLAPTPPRAGRGLVEVFA